MNQTFDTILDDCLARLQSGESLDSCLAAYPQHAEMLMPLIVAVEAVRTAPAPQARPQAAAAGQERMLAAFAALKEKKEIPVQPVSSLGLARYTERVSTMLRNILVGKETRGMKLALRIGIDLLVILFIGSLMTVSTSAKSLPGEPFYGVKRTWEQVRLAAAGPEVQQALEQDFSERRMEEIRSLVQSRREAEVELRGVLEDVRLDQITVNGLVFQIAPGTEIHGLPQIGQVVKVEGWVESSGDLLAREVYFSGSEDEISNREWQALFSPEETPAPVQTEAPVFEHDDDWDDDLHDDDLYDDDSDDDLIDDDSDDDLDDDRDDDLDDDLGDDLDDDLNDDHDDDMDDDRSDDDRAGDDSDDDDSYDDDHDDGDDDSDGGDDDDSDDDSDDDGDDDDSDDDGDDDDSDDDDDD